MLLIRIFRMEVLVCPFLVSLRVTRGFADVVL